MLKYGEHEAMFGPFESKDMGEGWLSRHVDAQDDGSDYGRSVYPLSYPEAKGEEPVDFSVGSDVQLWAVFFKKGELFGPFGRRDAALSWIKRKLAEESRQTDESYRVISLSRPP